MLFPSKNQIFSFHFFRINLHKYERKAQLSISNFNNSTVNIRNIQVFEIKRSEHVYTMNIFGSKNRHLKINTKIAKIFFISPNFFLQYRYNLKNHQMLQTSWRNLPITVLLEIVDFEPKKVHSAVASSDSMLRLMTISVGVMS